MVSRPRVRSILAAAVLLAAAISIEGRPGPSRHAVEAAIADDTVCAIEADGREPAARAPVEQLRADIRDCLAAGRVESALDAAATALRTNPGDDEVRAEFVALHVSLARNWISEERYTFAERALDAALRADSDSSSARELRELIQASRESVPLRLREAERWISLEWFEPAFVAYRQATALMPHRRAAWRSAYRAAAIGAGDDDYLTKNFHEAFYYYDAALRLGDEAGLAAETSLLDRWLQCLAHALSRDVDRGLFPPDFWRAALNRVGEARDERLPKGTNGVRDRKGGDIVSMIRGLAYENLGDAPRAAAAYSAFLVDRTAATGDLRQVRGQAVTLLRRRYDESLCGRRRGIWRDTEPGAWQVLERGRFRIHHHQAEAARRVGDALEFHFGRIASALSLSENEISWPVKCDVYLYRDAAAFSRATHQGGDVRAQSIINLRSGRLEAHEIHLFQTDPLLLSASTAHELTHVVAGAATHYKPLTGALSEGLALSLEPRCRHRQFARLFRELPRPRSLRTLLGIPTAHPTDAAFYAEAFRLTSELRTADGLTPLLEEAGRVTTAETLAKRFEFPTADALEESYLAKQGQVRAPASDTRGALSPGDAR